MYAIRSYYAPHILQHHGTGKNQGTGIHLIQSGIFGGGAVGRLENGAAVPDIGPGRHAQSADLSGQGVRNKIPVITSYSIHYTKLYELDMR